MALSTRDKWISAVLPGVFAASIYIYGTGGAAQKRMNAARADLALEQSKPLDARLLREAGAESQRINEALLAARAEAKSLSMLPPARFGPVTEDRGEPLRVISNIFSARGLFLTKSERVESDAKSALPKRMQDQWTKLSEKHKPPVPQIWRMEVWGTYAKVQAACEDLTGSSAFIVPLALSMESPQRIAAPSSEKNAAREAAAEAAASAGGIFKWTLTVWL